MEVFFLSALTLRNATAFPFLLKEQEKPCVLDTQSMCKVKARCPVKRNLKTVNYRYSSWEQFTSAGYAWTDAESAV